MAQNHQEMQVGSNQTTQENQIQKNQFEKEQAGHRQLPWKSEEDKIIMSFFDKSGSCLKLPWVQMAKEINQIVHNGIIVRNFHNCRERFLNHLNPGLVKGNWKQEEDHSIFSKKSKGFLWSQIQKMMPQRNVHQIKNRYYWIIQQYLQNNTYCIDIVKQVLGISSIEDFYLQFNQANDKQIISLLKKYKHKHQFKKQELCRQQLIEDNYELPAILDDKVDEQFVQQKVEQLPDVQPAQKAVQQSQGKDGWLYYGTVNPMTHFQPPAYQQYNILTPVSCWSAVQDCTVDYRNVFLPYQ